MRAAPGTMGAVPSPAASLRAAGQALLGLFLVTAGTAHVTVLRTEFRAQVPAWVPLDVDLVVVASGVVEVAVGAALLLTLVPGPTARGRVGAGLAAAALLVAVFPGNVAQYLDGTDAFGLTTDAGRLTRLFFQPLLVAWALWCTGAGGWLLARVRARP